MSDHGRSDDFSFGESSSSGDGSGTTSRLEISSPRLLWLFLGVAVALVGLGLAVFLGQLIVPAAAAWLLSGPLAIGLLAVFLHSESKRHSMPTFVDYGWLRAGYVLAMVLALAAVVVSAVRIALWVGRL